MPKTFGLSCEIRLWDAPSIADIDGFMTLVRMTADMRTIAESLPIDTPADIDAYLLRAINKGEAAITALVDAYLTACTAVTAVEQRGLAKRP